MSILSEILSTGHVDPELLEALDDEQKQLLFCQMRAEQVRKWELSEAEFERNGAPPRQPKRKQLRWLTGADGDVWVWVMGDHEKDKTIEEILEEESRETAHALALNDLKVASSDSDEDALMAQLGKMQVGGTTPNGILSQRNAHESNFDSDSESPYLLFQPNRQREASPNGVTSTTVSSFSTPQPQKPQFIRGERPPLMPKPQGYFATFTSPPIDAASMEATTSAPVSTPILTSSSSPTPNANHYEGLIINGVKLRPVRNGGEKREDEVQKRESEIFQSLLEHREKLQREAEAEEERRKAEWEELQRKSREADAAMRELAQKAREKHQQLIRTSTSILPALRDKNASSLREAIKNLPRPPKPRSRAAIVEWFKRDELPRGTGLDPKTRAPAPWFHGIISREDAEVLLRNKPTGSFLVRVSERIWGYTVSYASKDGTFKHFLVEKIPEGYQFLGTNQVVHDQLFDLVAYHETAPITAKGGEVLKWSVGQTCRPPDYSDLIQDPTPPPNYYGTYTNSNGSVVRTIPTTILRSAVGRF
ncbi:unnamed protein product [Caenorhabditis bovis]|uniref:SH2 domain-containing protein n=1 Tax=Caenorhabditis bovis TaxID=2654633 RepID=A0A8S1F6R0_9PELO|nr:unnamed protein product [Caenorhabditis bovis]